MAPVRSIRTTTSRYVVHSEIGTALLTLDQAACIAQIVGADRAAVVRVARAAELAGTWTLAFLRQLARNEVAGMCIQ